jgi:hypothetical protein
LNPASANAPPNNQLHSDPVDKGPFNLYEFIHEVPGNVHHYPHYIQNADAVLRDSMNRNLNGLFNVLDCGQIWDLCFANVIPPAIINSGIAPPLYLLDHAKFVFETLLAVGIMGLYFEHFGALTRNTHWHRIPNVPDRTYRDRMPIQLAQEHVYEIIYDQRYQWRPPQSTLQLPNPIGMENLLRSELWST